MDSNITIRTLVFADGEIAFGGWRNRSGFSRRCRISETLDKAAAMLKVLQQYGGEYERDK